MAYERHCYDCGKQVTCREELHPIAGSTKSVIHLFCPTCGRRLADLYDAVLAISRTRKG